MIVEGIVGYVERKGLGAAVRGVDVATNATFGSIGNWRHPPRLRLVAGRRAGYADTARLSRGPLSPFGAQAFDQP